MKGRRNPCLHFSCCFLPPLPPLSPLDKSYAPLFAAFTFPCRCRAQSRQQTGRSEEHTSELQSLMRISYAVFCLKKKNTTTIYKTYVIPLLTQTSLHSSTT